MILDMDATVLINRLDYVSCNELVSDLKARMASFHRDLPLTTEERQCVRDHDSIIPAVKMYRDRTKVSLSQAKHAIELFKGVDENEKYRRQMRREMSLALADTLRATINRIETIV